MGGLLAEGRPATGAGCGWGGPGLIGMGALALEQARHQRLQPPVMAALQ